MGGSKVPEPFDVRMEQAEEAGSLAAGAAQKKSKQDRSPAHSLRAGLNCALIAAARTLPLHPQAVECWFDL